MWGQKFHIVGIEPFLEELIVNIATNSYEEEKLFSLIESKIIEWALHDYKDIELWKFLNTFQGLSGSKTKDISRTSLVDSAPIKQKPYRSICNKKPEVNKQIQRMLSNGIIEHYKI